jgi:hypothetical protein
VSAAGNLNEEQLPPDGAYYILRGESGSKKLNNPKLMIEDLYSRGFEISHAWYRPTASVANSNTLVDWFLLLHLTNPDAGIERYFKFRQISNPRSFVGIDLVTEYRPATR